MSHSVKIMLIADQEITLFGQRVNVHNIKSILLDNEGNIVDCYAGTSEQSLEGKWMVNNE